MSTDPVKQHVITLLRRRQELHAAIEKRLTEQESAGARIVDGGSNSLSTWTISDYRTGEILAQGTDDDMWGYKTYLEEQENWVLFTTITEDLYRGEDETVVTEGVPETLAETLQDWLEGPSPHKDIADFTGWSDERVAQARADR